MSEVDLEGAAPLPASHSDHHTDDMSPPGPHHPPHAEHADPEQAAPVHHRVAKALVDRHHRQAGATPDADDTLGLTRHGGPSSTDALLLHLIEILTANAEEIKTSSQILYVDGDQIPQYAQTSFPGLTRSVIPRTPVPPANSGMVTTGALLLYDNSVNRFGGQIVNGGVNPVVLLLGALGDNSAGAQSAIVGSIFLAANGGAWNFKLSDGIWGGSVWGISLTGASTVYGAALQ